MSNSKGQPIFFKKEKNKNKIVCFAKIWMPPRQHFGLFEDWQNFGNPQKFGKFLELGVALIFRYLLTDLLLIQTKLALVQPRLYGWDINLPLAPFTVE